MKINNDSQKITFTLFLAQSFFSAGTIAMFTVLTIVGEELSGNADLAGVPTAVNLFAAAISAFIWGVLWDKIGRRRGISLGVLLGAVGLSLAVLATTSGSFLLLLAGLVGVGFSRSAMQLGRFIASEVNHPSRRGRAISIVVFGSTVGAIGGPLLVAPSGVLAQQWGLSELAGPFIIGAAMLLLALVVLQVGMRPEPMELARCIAAESNEDGPAGEFARKISSLLRDPGVLIAMTAMVSSQAVMTLLMGISPLHMKHLHFDLAGISIMLSSHTLGMFAPSIFTGWLVDRWGRAQVIIIGCLILFASTLLAPVYSRLEMISFALFLLGLGWNFCFVGGSALLADHLSPAERARTQGFNDLLISLVSAFASLGSGPVFARMGYGALSSLGFAITLIPLAATLWWLIKGRQRRATLQA